MTAPRCSRADCHVDDGEACAAGHMQRSACPHGGAPPALPTLGDVGVWHGWVDIHVRPVWCGVMTSPMGHEARWFVDGAWDEPPWAEAREAIFRAFGSHMAKVAAAWETRAEHATTLADFCPALYDLHPHDIDSVKAAREGFTKAGEALVALGADP